MSPAVAEAVRAVVVAAAIAAEIAIAVVAVRAGRVIAQIETRPAAGGGSAVLMVWT